MAAERAVEHERERIAAELHDVLAHTLGEMVVQAAAAGDLVRGLPADAALALERVADTGRSAIAETGRLLRLIRDEDNELGLGEAGAPAQIAAAPPQARGVASVRWRDAGLPAVLGVGGTLELLASSFHPMWLWIAMIWATAAVLCFRHRFPLAIPALAQLFPMIALVERRRRPPRRVDVWLRACVFRGGKRAACAAVARAGRGGSRSGAGWVWCRDCRPAGCRGGRHGARDLSGLVGGRRGLARDARPQSRPGRRGRARPTAERARCRAGGPGRAHPDRARAA